MATGSNQLQRGDGFVFRPLQIEAEGGIEAEWTVEEDAPQLSAPPSEKDLKIRFLERELVLMAQSLGEDHYDLSRICNSLSSAYHAVGRHAEGALMMMRYCDILEKDWMADVEKGIRSFEKDGPYEYFNRLDHLSFMYRSELRDWNEDCYRAAVQFEERLLTLRQRLLPANDPNIDRSRNNLEYLHGLAREKRQV